MKRLIIGASKGKSILSWRIRVWTWDDDTHVMLIDPQRQGLVTEAWHKGGVISNDCPEKVHKQGTVVDLFYIDVSEKQYSVIKRLADAQVGKPYNFKGPLMFINWVRPFAGKVPEDGEQPKWFCSCIIMWLFKVADKMLLRKLDAKTSPADITSSPIITPCGQYIVGVSDYNNMLKRVMSL